jgi:hypothetical protein
MYIADVGGGDANSRYESTKVLLAATPAGGARRKLAAGPHDTYTDEPRDGVSYAALASGGIPIGADDDIPTPKTRRQALSGKWSGDWIASSGSRPRSVSGMGCGPRRHSWTCPTRASTCIT